MSISVYLNFPGTTEEAFNFYKSIFGGEFPALQRFGDTPHGANMSDDEKEKIMHISLLIGKTGVIMGTDTLESQGRNLIVGNNFHINVNTESEAETDRIFNGLAESGKIELPLQNTFWGAYFGMCVDKFGIQWMVNCEKQK